MVSTGQISFAPCLGERTALQRQAGRTAKAWGAQHWAGRAAEAEALHGRAGGAKCCL